MDVLRYPYKPKAWAMALSGLFFAGCGVALGEEASENDRGLIINHVIHLDAADATIFYWVLAGLSAAFVGVALFALVRALGAPGEVVLDPAGITAPKRDLSGAPVTVPYSRITDLRMLAVGRQKILVIHHPDGKLNISRSMLPTHEDFGQIAAELHRRWSATRGG